MFLLCKLEDSSRGLTSENTSRGSQPERIGIVKLYVHTGTHVTRSVMVSQLEPPVVRDSGTQRALVKSLSSRKKGRKSLNMESQRGLRKV